METRHGGAIVILWLPKEILTVLVVHQFPVVVEVEKRNNHPKKKRAADCGS